MDRESESIVASDTCAEPDCHRDVYARGWCGMHYKRWLRTGSTIRGARPRTCSFEGCDADAKTRGWCHGHYQQWRHRGKDASALTPRRRVGPCRVAQCDRRAHARDLCATHYKRLILTGDVDADRPIRIVTGEGFEHRGYWMVPVAPEDRWLTGGERKVGEHRLVIARLLGRPLEPDESVHHINGDRLDNRPENLELWSCSHPSGQRVTDKVAWACALLRRYAPDLLVEDAAGNDERPLSR